MNNKEIIIVDAGILHIAKAPTILRADGLGSCVALMLYSRQSKVGGMAHIMLPYKIDNSREAQLQYADSALSTMLLSMRNLGVDRADICASVVGGAHVVPMEMDIGSQNVAAVISLLNYLRIPIVSQRVGGTKSRSVSFDLQNGSVHVKEGVSLSKQI